ncbi:hypothetical protein HDU76_001841 [Blyttiomyces sp. JEL0837]|nr:hypothetical protein HDU76_001841 [Blyttiomyces sp. JEL0837]
MARGGRTPSDANSKSSNDRLRQIQPKPSSSSTSADKQSTVKSSGSQQQPTTSRQSDNANHSLSKVVGASSYTPVTTSSSGVGSTGPLLSNGKGKLPFSTTVDAGLLTSHFNVIATPSKTSTLNSNGKDGPRHAKKSSGLLSTISNGAAASTSAVVALASGCLTYLSNGAGSIVRGAWSGPSKVLKRIKSGFNLSSLYSKGKTKGKSSYADAYGHDDETGVNIDADVDQFEDVPEIPQDPSEGYQFVGTDFDMPEIDDLTNDEKKYKKEEEPIVISEEPSPTSKPADQSQSSGRATPHPQQYFNSTTNSHQGAFPPMPYGMPYPMPLPSTDPRTGLPNYPQHFPHPAYMPFPYYPVMAQHQQQMGGGGLPVGQSPYGPYPGPMIWPPHVPSQTMPPRFNNPSGAASGSRTSEKNHGDKGKGKGKSTDTVGGKSIPSVGPSKANVGGSGSGTGEGGSSNAVDQKWKEEEVERLRKIGDGMMILMEYVSGRKIYTCPYTDCGKTTETSESGTSVSAYFQWIFTNNGNSSDKPIKRRATYHPPVVPVVPKRLVSLNPVLASPPDPNDPFEPPSGE